MNWATTITGLITGLLILASMVGILVSFNRNMQKATNQTLRENNKDLIERVDILEHENANKDERIKELEILTEKQGAEIQHLRDVIPGTSAIERLTKTIANQHQETMKILQMLGSAIAEIGRMRGVADE
jgi:uncharacterized protein (UPF0335 family)